MDLGIKNKKALVTGASRGLGRSIAECLAREGAAVALVARSSDQLDAFKKEFGNHHIGLTYDLMEKAAPGQMVGELSRAFGYPDIVVHNVGGTLDITEPFCSIEDWQKVYRFNLEIAVELNLLLLPHMQEQKWGRVVHISSVAALENQGTVPYCSMKAALCAYTRSMGRFVSKDGVNISAVLPGAVYTEGGYWDKTSKTRPEHVERYLSERMAIQRFGTPDEIGKVVAFLCSEYASFVVGSNLLVDGGQGKGFTQDVL
jgi:3-oxoacyl-[acyl-carrier protein] reductase